MELVGKTLRRNSSHTDDQLYEAELVESENEQKHSSISLFFFQYATLTMLMLVYNSVTIFYGTNFYGEMEAGGGRLSLVKTLGERLVKLYPRRKKARVGIVEKQ